MIIFSQNSATGYFLLSSFKDGCCIASIISTYFDILSIRELSISFLLPAVCGGAALGANITVVVDLFMSFTRS